MSLFNRLILKIARCKKRHTFRHRIEIAHDKAWKNWKHWLRLEHHVFDACLFGETKLKTYTGKNPRHMAKRYERTYIRTQRLMFGKPAFGKDFE